MGGDSRVAAIAAASIVAKVHRDAHMAELDRHHPGYGFARHAGYGTPEHLASARARSARVPIHRRSFEPVRACAARVGRRMPHVVIEGVADLAAFARAWQPFVVRRGADILRGDHLYLSPATRAPA